MILKQTWNEIFDWSNVLDNTFLSMIFDIFEIGAYLASEFTAQDIFNFRYCFHPQHEFLVRTNLTMSYRLIISLKSHYISCTIFLIPPWHSQRLSGPACLGHQTWIHRVPCKISSSSDSFFDLAPVRIFRVHVKQTIQHLWIPLYWLTFPNHNHTQCKLHIISLPHAIIQSCPSDHRNSHSFSAFSSAYLISKIAFIIPLLHSYAWETDKR